MRTAGKAALLFVLFLLSVCVTVLLSRQTASFSVVWPATAIALGFLLLAPPREWPIYALAAGAGNYAAVVLAGHDALTALVLSACNLLEVLAAAAVLHRLRTPGGWLSTVRSLIVLLGITGVMVPALGAALAAAVIHVIFGAPYGPVWQNRWIADAVGMLVIPPLLLAWRRPERSPPEKRPGVPETLAIVAGLALTTALAFNNVVGSEGIRHTSLILALPFQIWATLRFGLRGATTSSAFVMLAGIGGMLAFGATILDHDDPAEALTTLQAFFAATSLATLLLAAALGERRTAEARLRGAIESMNEGLTLYDADGKLVLTNRRTHEIYPDLGDALMPGSSYETFLRRGVERGLFSTDGRPVDAWLTDFMKLPADQRQELETDLADGRWLLISRQRTADGGSVQVRTDITRLKQQENALRENEERLRVAEARLRDAVESIGEGITLFDAEDRLVLSNAAHRRWYGKGADLFVPGTRFEDIIRAGIALGHHPDAVGREEEWIAQRLERHRNPGEPFEQPLGEGRWERVSERRTSDGGTVGVWSDISRLKVHEEILRANEERLRAAEGRARAAEQRLLDAIEQLDEAFVLFDADDKLVLCNERFREMCNESVHPVVPGISFETIVRDRAEGGFIADAEGRIEDWIAERMQQHRNPTSSFELQEADGRWLLIADRRTADGGYVGIRTDITRLKLQGQALKVNEDRLRGMLSELEDSHAKLERQSFMLTRLADEAAARGQQAQAANLAKSQFLANISHELRTPLNAILGFSEMMKDEILGPLGSAQYRGYAADIHDSGALLLSVINDLLDLSKIEAGKYELHEEDCDSGAILRGAMRLVAERADAAGIGLREEVAAELPRLHADRRLVKQILLNLLSNAIKFTPTGGRITVSAELDETGGLQLTVADTGIGIPLDQMERVLQPFAQVENIMTRSHSGTGLGLPLCKALADLHGARLLLTSELGVGTTVTVAFPRERTVQPSSQERTSSAA